MRLKRNKYFSAALRCAKRSRHEKQKMAAIVVKGGRVLSLAPNGERTGRHAEIRAIASDTHFTGATIAVARVGEGVSRPCRTCFRLIKSVGIRNMVFVDENGNLVKKDVGLEDEKDYKESYWP